MKAAKIQSLQSLRKEMKAVGRTLGAAGAA